MKQPRFHRWWPSLFRYDRQANPITALPIREKPAPTSTELDELIQYWRDSYALRHNSLFGTFNEKIALTIYYLQQLKEQMKNGLPTSSR